jgi:aspartate aminotransferase
MRLANRLADIPVASTSRMRSLAQKLTAEGRTVVNLAAGELAQQPPEALVSALGEAARTGHNGYTDTAGLATLREGLAERHSRRTSVEYRPSEAIVTPGAKTALHLAALSLLDPGDEALIPAPHWVTFPAQVTLAGARPVSVDTTGTRFQLTAKQLEAARTPRTRVVVLNTPNNPTGAVLGERAVADITRWAMRNDVFIVFDESYAELTFAGSRHVNPVSVVPEARDHVLSVGSFSKQYAITGWRAGFAVGPEPVIAAMKKLQGHATSNAPTPVQHAMVRGLADDLADYPRESTAALEGRYRLLADELSGIGGLRWEVPRGGFFLFLDCRDVLRTAVGRLPGAGGSTELAEHLLDRHGVATVPGAAFGAEGFLRVSFAVGDADVALGAERLAKAFVELG